MSIPAPSEAPKAYSYMRFSTLEQGKGDSLNRQTTMAREWCERHGVPLDTDLIPSQRHHHRLGIILKPLAGLGDLAIARPGKMIRHDRRLVGRQHLQHFDARVGRLFRIGIVGKFHPRFFK
jgi:hypothetical protein